jgi:signal transduction histidine kinase
VSLSLSVDVMPDTGLPCTVIRVDDSGVGIPLADHDKLFGAFSRINTARPNAPEGTGLGLHLSQKLAELLGGKIVFRSESGEGSSFSLVLPGA